MQNRVRASLVAASLLLVPAPLLASGLTPISQNRSITAQAEASGNGGDIQDDTSAAPDFNPFSDLVSAGANWNDPNNSADASASATQNSQILPAGIVGDGTADANASSSGPFGSANAFGDSTLQVTFTVAQTCAYTLDADLNGFVFDGIGDGVAGVLLQDSIGTFLVFDEANNDSRTVAATGILTPGTYTISAYAFAGAFADNFFFSGSGTAGFELDFQLSPPCLGVEFESQPLGMQWGGPVGNAPGDLIFSENGIGVRVEFFNFAAGGGLFNLAQIDSSFSGFGSNQIMRTNNINLGFDLSTTPNCGVEIDVADLGGTENLQVNGAALFVGNLPAAPAAIAPGVTLSLLNVAAIPGGYQGTLRLDGNVTKLVLGGQEFWVDNLCPIPPCPGDTDGDKDVDVSDLATVLAEFGLVGGGLAGDVDFDGDVDLSDLSLVLANFGLVC